MDHTHHGQHQAHVPEEKATRSVTHHQMQETSGSKETDHEHHHTGTSGKHEGHSVEGFQRRFWISLAMTVPIVILSPMLQMWIGLDDHLRFPGDGYILFIISTVLFLCGGYPFLNGLIRELRRRRPGMMTLIGVAISVAYIYSSLTTFGFRGMDFFWELATLIDIMLLGHWIEMKSVNRASKALEELAKLLPSDAHRLNANGMVEDIPLSEVRSGDKLLVRPGEKIPADSLIEAGESSVNESMLTGESNPVSKTPGSKVIGGAINGEGSLTIKVERTGSESFLSQVITLVREAQESKSETENLADRAAFWLTLIALLGGISTWIVWFVVLNADLAFSLERTVTVMVIACPHALGLAIPLVVAVSTTLSARKGFLIRNRKAFENARNITAVIFDKTGTLTEGKFGITDIIPLKQDGQTLPNEEVLSLAIAIENHSEHPIAKGITSSVPQKIIPREVSNFKAIPGKGAEGNIGAKTIAVVSPGYLRERKIEIRDDRIDSFYREGKTIVFVVSDGVPAGAIALADRIKPEAKDAIAGLKLMGISTIMITGDNKEVAARVAHEIGLDTFVAEVLPQDKAMQVKDFQAQGLVVAMTGDGVNDAPALAQADVGIAIGAGTDVAVETSDIVLVRSNPTDVLNVIHLSRTTYRKMIQNLLWATGYNIFAIPLAAGVLASEGILLSPAVGAVLMSLSTVIVALNARLLRS